jgi:hypothetical protein
MLRDTKFRVMIQNFKIVLGSKPGLPGCWTAWRHDGSQTASCASSRARWPPEIRQEVANQFFTEVLVLGYPLKVKETFVWHFNSSKLEGHELTHHLEHTFNLRLTVFPLLISSWDPSPIILTCVDVNVLSSLSSFNKAGFILLNKSV